MLRIYKRLHQNNVFVYKHSTCIFTHLQLHRSTLHALAFEENIPSAFRTVTQTQESRNHPVTLRQSIILVNTLNNAGMLQSVSGMPSGSGYAHRITTRMHGVVHAQETRQKDFTVCFLCNPQSILSTLRQIQMLYIQILDARCNIEIIFSKNNSLNYAQI